MTETAENPTKEYVERLGALSEAPVGTVLTTDDQAALRFILETCSSLYADNQQFYTALCDIAFERNEINGKGRMQRRAMRALGDRVQ